MATGGANPNNPQPPNPQPPNPPPQPPIPQPPAQGPAAFINLPVLGSRQAPPEFRGSHRTLRRFLLHYERCCAQYQVTQDDQKCLGLPSYCSDNVATTIESLESFINGDYQALVKDLQWLYDGDRQTAEYHTGYIEEFGKEWRKETVANLETFKQYHREYIEVAGHLKNTNRIDANRFNQGFWEGLPADTRDRLERRMTDEDPSLDLAVPFPIEKIVKAAEFVFSRNRFDKHLREGLDLSIRPKEKGESSRRPRSRKRREEASDAESEEEYVPRWRKAAARRNKVSDSPAIKREVSPKRVVADEVDCQGHSSPTGGKG